MTNRRARVVDLFCGYGGLGLGFEQAGCDIDLAVDVEADNIRTHSAMFSYGRHEAMDLSEDRTAHIRRIIGNNADIDALTMGRTPDAIVGGPPCQGISVMGNRDPADDRNALMASFIDHVIRLGASYAVMEQVPTLLQPQNAGLLDDLRERLHRGGYGMVDPRILYAPDFGVPQRRSRVFLLIHRHDRAAPTYPAPTHGPETGDGLWERGHPTVADAFDGLPDADDYDELNHRDWVRTDFPMPTGRYARLMRGTENDPDDFGYRRAWDPMLLTCSRRTDHAPDRVARFMETPPGGSDRISRRHRLDPAGLALTLRAGTDAKRGSYTSVVPIHPKGSRSITAREAARLHSIPDWVRLSPRKITAYRQIGNSVCPLVARAVGSRIIHALGIVPVTPHDVIPLGREADDVRRTA